MRTPKKPVPRAKAVEAWMWRDGYHGILQYDGIAATERGLLGVFAKPFMGCIPVRVRITEVPKKRSKKQ